MAKLILTFKGKPLQVYHFDSGEAIIGRNDECSIQIDSLAIATAHASIRFAEQGDTIRALQKESLVLVNDKKIEEHKLSGGDRITIGKHELSYFDEENVPEQSAAPKPKNSKRTPVGVIDSVFNHQSANLQILSGKNIGLVIPLKKAMTKLGKQGTNAAVIAKRKDGFFISALEDGSAIKVNRTPINDNIVKLSHGDKIDVDSSSLKFFAEA